MNPTWNAESYFPLMFWSLQCQDSSALSTVDTSERKDGKSNDHVIFTQFYELRSCNF